MSGSGSSKNNEDIDGIFEGIELIDMEDLDRKNLFEPPTEPQIPTPRQLAIPPAPLFQPPSMPVFSINQFPLIQTLTLPSKKEEKSRKKRKSCSTALITQQIQSEKSDKKKGTAPDQVVAKPEAPKNGVYTKEQRAEAIQRYRAKRKNRTFGRIIYQCRKDFADSRPRVGGKFVKIYQDGPTTKKPRQR